MAIPQQELKKLLELGLDQHKIQELWPQHQSANKIADILLQTQHISIPPLSEDEQIKKAIKLSTESNPHFRELRNESTPVGLANIGNSCYFNCIIQIYFNIHKFVEFILKVELNQRITNNILIDQSKQLIYELRQLFYRMIASKQQALDPSKVVKSILADDQQPVHQGNQYDAGEFNQILLQRISNAISESTNDQLNTYLAALCQSETSSYILIDGKKYVQPNEKITILLLEPKYGELLQAMIGYCQQRIDGYQHGNTIYNNIPKYTIFQRLPRVLFIQIQRTHYNKITNQTEKDNTQFRISPEIDLSIFLDENKIKGFSDQIYQQTEEINRLKQRQQKQNYWIDRDIIKSLETSLEYMRQLPIKDEATKSAEMILEKQISQIKAQKANYQNQITTLENQILLKSQDLSLNKGNHRYWLQGIIMHQGEANLGHYYCYIYDFQKRVWRKYSDSLVTEVDEQDVFEKAQGQGNLSAFCLTYVNEEYYQDYQDGKTIKSYLYPENIKNDYYYDMIPQNIREEIINENKNVLNQKGSIIKNQQASQINKKIIIRQEINYADLVDKCFHYYKIYSQLFDKLEDAKKVIKPNFINLRDVAFFARQLYPQYIQIILCDLIAVSQYNQSIIDPPNLDKLEAYLKTKDLAHQKIISRKEELYSDGILSLQDCFKTYRIIYLAISKLISLLTTNIMECAQILTYIRIIQKLFQKQNCGKPFQFEDLLLDITLFLTLIMLVQINKSSNNQKINYLELLQALNFEYCHIYIEEVCRWLQEMKIQQSNAQVSASFDSAIKCDRCSIDLNELKQKYSNTFIDQTFQLIGNLSPRDEQLEMIQQYNSIKELGEFTNIKRFQSKVNLGMKVPITQLLE